MYIRRSMSKLVKSASKSPLVLKIKDKLENTPIIFEIIRRLPPFGLLLFSTYYGLGISSIILDIVFLFILLLVLGGLFLNAQDWLLYFPNEPSTARVYCPSPSQYNINYENLTIPTSDGSLLHAYLLKHEKYDDKPTIIMFHGNAGNIGYRVENAYTLVNHCAVNVLMMEYRGYGRSGGVISENGLYDDGLSTVRYLRSRKDLDPTKIVVYGRSLGGAVAVQVASEPECSDLYAVIIENSFSSLPDIAKKVLNFSIVKSVPDWCYKNKYPSIERIARVRQPTLFLSGRSDDLVPARHMDRLHEASGSIKKEMSSFPKGTHNETWLEPGYFFAIQNFLHRL